MDPRASTRLPLFVRVDSATVDVQALAPDFLCLFVDESNISGKVHQTSTMPERIAPVVSADGVAIPRHSLIALSVPLSRFTVGRSDRADVVIPDTRISGVHCAIEHVIAGRFKLIDQLSSNGTYVKDRAIAPGPGGAAVLEYGDAFILADTPVWLHNRASLADAFQRLRG